MNNFKETQRLSIAEYPFVWDVEKAIKMRVNKEAELLNPMEEPVIPRYRRITYGRGNIQRAWGLLLALRNLRP